jgi:hypothetical protein
MESSIDEEYKYIIQILPSVLRNLAEANQDNTLRNFIKLVHWVLPLSTIFHYIVAVSFTGGGNRRT